MEVLEGAVVFSVDWSWVVDAVSTVVFMLVIVNVDSVVYDVVDEVVIAVDGVVDAVVVFTAIITVEVGGDVVSVFGIILP